MENTNRYAGVLVKSNNKVLLCKRNNKGDLPGEWSIPCGRIKEGESPVTGAKREYYEETDNEVSGSMNLIGIIKRTSREGKNTKGLLYVFYTEENEELLPDLNNAQDGDEHTECGYFSKNELPSPLGSQLKDLILKII